MADEVCILGGYFSMGHDPLPYSMQVGAVAQYAPKHWVHLSPFFIDQYPVTNAQYLACFQAGACPNECQATGACSGRQADSYHIADPTLAEYPAATITVSGSQAYCTWKGKRLATEAEWERAARGPKSFDYPWGNDAPDCSQLHCGELAQPTLSPPYNYYYPVLEGGADVSPEGVHDTVTNVVEVVNDFLDVYYYASSPMDDPQGPATGTARVARGKTWWTTPEEYSVMQAPFPAWARERYSVEGFRCARDGSTRGASAKFLTIRQEILTGSTQAMPRSTRRPRLRWSSPTTPQATSSL